MEGVEGVFSVMKRMTMTGQVRRVSDKPRGTKRLFLLATPLTEFVP